MKKLLIASLITLASSSVAAQDYQFEIGAEYEANDAASAAGILGQAFFSKVETEGHALRESAYMERKSNIYASYVNEDYDGFGSENATRIGGELYIPKAYLFLGAQYTTAGDGDWGLTLGVTPIEGLRITTQYWDEPGYDFNLQGKYVADLAGGDAINVELGYYDGEVDDTVSLEFDYYFGPSLSLGAIIANTVDTDYTIKAEKFFADRFSVNASYMFGEYDDTWGIGAAVRF